MVSSVPMVEHTFSPDFLRRMKKLIRRAEHPAGHRVLRQAGAAAAALILAFTLLYAASPTVRAAVNSWVRSAFGDYFQYSPVETTPPDAQYDYALPEEFDGYTLLDAIDRGEDYLYIYTNEEGQMLFFEYLRNTSDSSMFLLDVENHAFSQDYVGSVCADIYIAPTADETSIIVWHNSDENVLFCIQATADRDQLIAFAEKIEKISKK